MSRTSAPVWFADWTDEYHPCPRLQVEVANFRSAQTRGMFEEAVRLHVLGSNSALDRQLRGVATVGVTPAALRLPPGEAVLRSYACALYALLRNHRGALHVCRSLLLFSGREDANRTVLRCAAARRMLRRMLAYRHLRLQAAVRQFSAATRCL